MKLLLSLIISIGALVCLVEAGRERSIKHEPTGRCLTMPNDRTLQLSKCDGDATEKWTTTKNILKNSKFPDSCLMIEMPGVSASSSGSCSKLTTRFIRSGMQVIWKENWCLNAEGGGVNMVKCSDSDLNQMWEYD